ncbi:MAG: ATP-binding protein [Methanotrichaceae archaeon]
MKIRTQLIVSMVFFGIALAIISASVISTNQQVERLSKQEKLAKNIELNVGELSYLSNDYLLYHESQQIDRWKSKYSSISADISNLTVEQPEQQVLANNIRANGQRLNEIFDDIVSKVKSAPQTQQNTADLAFIQVSGSRIGVQTQGIVFDASRLAQMLSQQADETKQRNNLLIFALMGAFMAFLITDYLLIYRRTLTSISNLQAGARIIGSGNLDYSIVEKKDDEISDLAKAFNQMTANLKTITASKADLEREVAERKRAEEEIRRSEKRFRSIFESTQDAILTIDNDMYCTSANPGASAITGIPHEQLIGQFLPDFVDPSFDLSATWHAFIKTGRFAGEVGIRHKEGTFRTIDAIGIANILSGQHLLVGHDITERKAMEEALRKAKDELEQRVQERTAELSDAKENLEVINEELQVEISEHEKTEKELIAAKEEAEAAVEAKAAFLANMSHELRTPLNAVIGFSSLLLADNLTQEQKEDIERIRNGGEALLSIISDILEFSKAEKEKVKLELQPLSLKACIEESLDMVAVQANDKGLNLAYTIAYGTPDIIIGDPGRLRQILANLLSNAVKFTDAGDISVSVSSETIEGDKRQITFAVTDTGIGMPQDKMDRLFKPFAQLEYTISRKRDGAGLGLAICKKLVELMDGEIWAESEEGIGSTFRFTIQAEAIPGKQLDLDEKDMATEYENLSGQNPLAILVAEDNPSNQRVLVEMLKRLGYRADAVADGVEVLQALQIRQYDLIFMDIKMPEMDGITATKEIRKLWPENGPKVVAITAFAMDGDRELCLEAGMNGYIAKPVKVDDLATLLRSVDSAKDKI